jgi:hypothetical protein
MNRLLSEKLIVVQLVKFRASYAEGSLLQSTHVCLKLDPTLSQMGQLHSPTPHLFKMCFNNCADAYAKSPKQSVSLKFPN